MDYNLLEQYAGIDAIESIHPALLTWWWMY